MPEMPSRQLGPSPAHHPFWIRHLRREMQFLLDLGVLTLAFVVAYLLRFEFAIPEHQLQRLLVQVPLVVLLQFTIVFLLGTYNFVWRYVGLAEVRTFVNAAAYSALLLLAMRVGLPEALDGWRVPLSIILLDAILGFGGLLGLRVLRRSLYERFERNRRVGEERREGRRILFVGAGRAGVLAAREVSGRRDLNLVPIGFVDDDAQKQGSVIHGLKVLGTTADLPALVPALEVDRVVITIAEAEADTVRRVVRHCEKAGVRVQIIPGLYELLQGKISISRFRDIQIEDLLGRDPVRLDEEVVRRFVSDRRVMVTGAGGSIGAELTRQVVRFGPRSLLLLDRAEGALFEIEREIVGLEAGDLVTARVGDAGDPHLMRRLLERHRPQVVLHAAAYKHVPMMEQNAAEAVRNNVLGTANLASLAGQFDVETFVLISTDKAVEPTSVMGATKRLAELVIQGLGQQHRATKYLAVRFGNVLGSAGSVVPLFRQQIERGGPVTVTHPDARRYFMTIPEAAQLVLEAGALGENGEILILDMGEPVRIVDLAEDLIALSGLKPYQEVSIVFTGLRPGEKLFERLELSSERVDGTRHPKIFVGKLDSLPAHRIARALTQLRTLVEAGAEDAIRQELANLIPESDLRLAPRSAAPADPLAAADDVLH